MKSPLITTQATAALVSIGMIGCLLPILPSSAQETDTPKPGVPQVGVGGPTAIDLEKAGVVSRADLSLYEIVAGAANFTTLAAALRASGFDKRLNEEGAVTLLAPDNAAFAALPEGVLSLLLKPENIDMLKSLLNFHIIPEKVAGTGFVPGKLKTSQGESLTVVTGAEGKVTIQGAGFGDSNIEGENGVIHVVKAVLIPPSIDIEDFQPAESAE